MFPLKVRTITGYRFGVPTFYSNFHLGVDYGSGGLEVKAPFDGQIVKVLTGTQGGKTLWFKPSNSSVVMRFLHLSQFLVANGQSVTMGQQIAVTGNTGQTTKPHLHLDISKNAVNINNTSNFIDPEKYVWEEVPTPMPVQFPIKIKASMIINGPQWATADQKIQQVKDWYTVNSQNKLQLDFTLRYVNFDQIPFGFFPDGSGTVDEPWFDAHILDPLADTTIFIIRDEDFPDNYPGGLKAIGRTSGFLGKKPTKTVIGCSENQMSPAWPQLNGFFDFVRHELFHTCSLFSGSYIPHPLPQGDEYFGSDKTHYYFYPPNYQPGLISIGNPEGAFVELNYENINQTLKGVNMAQIKSQAKGASRRIVLEAADLNEWAVLCKVYGKDKDHPEENVN